MYRVCYRHPETSTTYYTDPCTFSVALAFSMCMLDKGYMAAVWAI